MTNQIKEALRFGANYCQTEMGMLSMLEALELFEKVYPPSRIDLQSNFAGNRGSFSSCVALALPKMMRLAENLDDIEMIRLISKAIEWVHKAQSFELESKVKENESSASSTEKVLNNESLGFRKRLEKWWKGLWHE